MSTRGTPITLAVTALTAVAALADPNGPELGRPVTAAAITAWDIDVAVDGTGLPSGEGSVKDGEGLYEIHCEVCHGPEGIGGSADELAGSDEPLDGDWPDKTIGTYWPYAATLFDFIRRSKPMNRPGSLSNDEVYALSAYLLYLNDIVSETIILNAATLAAVEMPNRDGFTSCYPAPERHEAARWQACNP